MTIRLADPEARVLEGFCRRQLRWDDRLSARVVTSGHALGVFTTPPLGVLVFVAVPTIDPVPEDEAVDVTVQLVSLADALGCQGEQGLDLGRVHRASGVSPIMPSVQYLPPTEGWQLPMFGISEDLVPLVAVAAEEFAGRSAGLSERGRETVAADIWDRPAWAGLPMRALHAARQLGMLTSDRAKVSAATCGPWRRLSTSRGQVFVHVSGPGARLALHVVR